MSEITNAEFEVLSALWKGSPATANEIIERLNEDKPWHDKTVKTLLSRMVKKDVISFEKQQRSYLYSPLIAQEVYSRQESQSLVEKLFSGKVSPLIASFAKSKALDQEDIKELKSIISSWEEENIDIQGENND